VQQHFLLIVLVLIADELERVIQRLDRGLERAFHRAASKAQLVDAALDLFETRLRFLDDEIRAPFRFTDGDPRLVLRGVLDVVGQLLRREQRIAEVSLACA
jgi:hypothetical protein